MYSARLISSSTIDRAIISMELDLEAINKILNFRLSSWLLWNKQHAIDQMTTDGPAEFRSSEQ